ncbi:MAG: uroporphyrinogen decarboxylase family protein [Phycisphaerae bacterium]
MPDQSIPPLPREEVYKAIERKGPSRIPLVRAKWWGEGLEDQYGDQLRRFDRIPEDAVQIFINPVQPWKMNLSWDLPTGGSHDATVIIQDWSQLDEFIEKLPDPETDGQVESCLEQAKKAREKDMYITFGWWRLFFEKPWGLRGMENLMIDYYENPEQVHRLHSALCDLYSAYVRKAAEVLQPDGFWCSDDLGHQTQPMMSPAIFRTLIKPYYVRFGETLRAVGIPHWWLHSCGNNAPLMDDFIEAGVSVFHPVQKGTMDEKEIAETFGDRLTFLAGIDVQHTLQEKDPDGVREEVRFLIDTFHRNGGGMCIAAGNGIVSGTPIENIEAFLDEAITYGTRAAGRR